MNALRILIVEHEAVRAEELNGQLAQLGYQVTGTAGTTAEAVRLAEEQEADLVFVNVRLAGPGGGIGAAEELRQRFGLPVVFLTTHADRDDLERAKAVGPSGFVHEPWRPRDLQTAVELAVANHHVERRLRESAEHYRATLDGIEDGILAVDAAGRVTLLNAAAERITGWSRREAAGQPLDRVCPLVRETDGETLLHPLDPSNSEAVLIRRDGNRILVQERVTPLGAAERSDEGRGRAPAGNPAGVLGPAVVTFRDVSEQRWAEAALRETQKMESIGLLAGGLAHDFNNLLTPILGFADLLRQHLEGDGVSQGMLDGITTAAQQAARLTGQLLAYAGQGLLRVEPMDLSVLVSGMTALLTTAVSRKATLAFDLTATPLLVEADATQMRQVVMNLVTNASEALGDGEGTIHVRTGHLAAGPADLVSPFIHPSPPPGRYGFLEIEDTGSGMDEATLARIFDPFFTTRFVGRGLGLSAVLGIVKGHGGSLQITSAVNRGSRFRVLLPVSTAQLARPEPAPAFRADRIPGTVLLAEDEELVRLFAQEALTGAGLVVLAACDGQEAVDLFRARRAEIDVVLLDQTMPRLNGIEALTAIRAEAPDVPVLLMSGYTLQRIAATCPDLALTGCIEKPFRAEYLIAVVQEALSRSRKPG